MQSSVRATSARGRPAWFVDARIYGLEKTSQEFRSARREINTRLRDALQAAGQSEVLPYARAAFPRRTGRMAESLFIKRDRLFVVIASRYRGGRNRAVGWIDFGGRRKWTTKTGHQHVDKEYRRPVFSMHRTVDRRRDALDRRVLLELMRVFDGLDHHP